LLFDERADAVGNARGDHLDRLAQLPAVRGVRQEIALEQRVGGGDHEQRVAVCPLVHGAGQRRRRHLAEPGAAR
jgi:hypothetical protein